MKIKNRVAIIIGTKAECIKCIPLMLELQRRNISYHFIHTGQHNLQDLCEHFSIKKPDIILTKEPTKSSKFYAKVMKAIFWNLGMIFKIRKELKKHKEIEYVMYHGDTMSTLSSSISSSRLLNPFKKYKNVHIEAGLRSTKISEPFPEEIARIIADYFSDVLLSVSKRSKNNLKKYEKSKKIFLVGNTIIDSVDIAYKMAIKEKIKPLGKRFALISVHRHENIKNKERLEAIVEILLSLKIPSYFPLHDNTKKKLEEFGLMEKLLKNKNIKIVDQMGYVSFIYQLSRCSLILCDGGSLQEESLIFKKPCIILRKATERQEGLESNFQFLSGLDVEKTKEKTKEFLSKDFKAHNIKNPYGKIGVSKKILENLGL